MAAPTITSFTPTTVSTDGGDTVTITGTNLASANAATINGKAAQLLAEGRTATNLALRVPANPAGAYKIVLTDETDVVLVESAGTLTYAVTDTPRGSTTSATKFKVDVDLSDEQDGSDWSPLRGRTSLVPSAAATKQDDTDFDDVDDLGMSWQSQTVTQLAWTITGTVGRKKYAGDYDAAQEALRLAAEKGGDPAIVHVRWYDRTGGPESYEGFAIVEWTPKGGGTTDLDMVDFTLTGKGPRTTVPNPAAS